MSYIMKGTELAAKAQEIAKNYKTLYAVGAFGAPLNARNKQRYSNNCPQNKRREKLYMAASTDTFVFDCSGMIKGILGGWCGNKNVTYGGVTVKKVDGKLVYGDYNFPDYEPNGMIKACSSVSSDFSKIEVGEMLWLDGHAGVYIGNGLAAEATSAWDCKVQITAVGNIGTKEGYKTRKWTKHGKLPMVDYSSVIPVPTPTPAPQPTPTPTPTPTPKRPEDVKMRLIKTGSKGDAVKLWQEIMVLNNIKVGDPPRVLSVDGDFGQLTKSATLIFQKQAFPNEPKEWDGQVGDKTWTKGFESVK